MDDLQITSSFLTQLEVPRKRWLFILGSFEKRVTLCSQQKRALNLIYSLRVQNRLKPKDRVAVIGGGVAGMTVAAAANQLGCEVSLFEKRDTLLPLLRKNRTRWLHPHIYDWPLLGWEQEDAGLPLMNWRAGIVDDVVQQFDDNWKPLQHDIRFIPDAEIEPSEDQYVRWNQTGHGHSAEKFDIIVLALGFGIEDFSGDCRSNSYWDNDNLDRRNNYYPRETKRFLVSGTGDGGLIDLMRISLDGFDQDKTIIELLKYVSGTAVEKVREIEFDASNQKLSSQAVYDRLNNEVAVPELREIIRARLRKDTVAELNGKGSVYIDMKASALNRFLAFQLLKTGVKYRSGVIPETSIKYRNGKYSVVFNSVEKYEFDAVIRRYGPVSALEKHYPALWIECEQKMREYAELDQTRFKIWKDDFYGASNSASAPQSNENISVRTLERVTTRIKLILPGWSQTEEQRLWNNMENELSYGSEVAIMTSLGRYIGIELKEGSATDTRLKGIAMAEQASEMFTIIDPTALDGEPSGKPLCYGDKIALRAAQFESAQFVGANFEAAGVIDANAKIVGNWQVFTLLSPPGLNAEDGSRLRLGFPFALQAFHYKPEDSRKAQFVKCDLNPGANHGTLIAGADAIKAWETFVFVSPQQPFVVG